MGSRTGTTRKAMKPPFQFSNGDLVIDTSRLKIGVVMSQTMYYDRPYGVPNYRYHIVGNTRGYEEGWDAEERSLRPYIKYQINDVVKPNIDYYPKSKRDTLGIGQILRIESDGITYLVKFKEVSEFIYCWQLSKANGITTTSILEHLSSWVESRREALQVK